MRLVIITDGLVILLWIESQTLCLVEKHKGPSFTSMAATVLNSAFHSVTPEVVAHSGVADFGRISAESTNSRHKVTTIPLTVIKNDHIES